MCYSRDCKYVWGEIRSNRRELAILSYYRDNMGQLLNTPGQGRVYVKAIQENMDRVHKISARLGNLKRMLCSDCSSVYKTVVNTWKKELK
jgi:hypothetical protein